MADNGFGSELWKNLQAVQFDKDGSLRAPVRADGKKGIVIGVDAVAEAESAAPTDPPEPSARRRWWQRVWRARS